MTPTGLVMEAPEQIAREIVERFAWTSNVMHEGRLVGQQAVVALAIAEAITDERSRFAKLEEEVGRLRETSVAMVDELIAAEPPGRSKLMLTIAARAIRRGRNLTASEKLANLTAALANEGES